MFGDPTSFSETQSKEWFVKYLLETSYLQEILKFTTGYSTMPFQGLKGDISVRYLADDENYIMPTSSACLKILYLPTVHTKQNKFFEMLDIAFKFESEGFANP